MHTEQDRQWDPMRTTKLTCHIKKQKRRYEILRMMHDQRLKDLHVWLKTYTGVIFEVDSGEFLFRACNSFCDCFK